MSHPSALSRISQLHIERNVADFTQRVPLTSRLLSILSPARNVVYGIDVNRFQDGEIEDADAIRQSGYDFVILEATWGLWVPETFAKFWPKFVDAGFIVLCYGFFRGDQSGNAQANLLLETVRPCYEAQGFWMPVGADVEPFNGDISTLSQRQANFTDWGSLIYTETDPMAYSNIPSWSKLMGNMPLPKYFVEWAAHWANTDNPLVATGWPRRPPEFHQDGIANIYPNPYPWVLPIDGISGDVSRDKFYGTRDDLLSYRRPIGGTQPPCGDINLQPVIDLINAQTEVLVGKNDEEIALLKEIKEMIEAGGGTTPPPTTDFINIIVTDTGRTAAKEYDENNQSGFPKFRIYDDQNGKRVTFDNGLILKAYPDLIRGDGANNTTGEGHWFRLAPQHVPAGLTPPPKPYPPVTEPSLYLEQTNDAHKI